MTFSTTDIIAISAIVVAISVVVGFTLFRKAQLRLIEKQTALLKAKTEAIYLRRLQENTVQSNQCKYCNSTIEVGTVFCPVCHRALK